MLRTKKDVDKHVRSTLSKLREDEKNLRGFRIAGLYYNIGEYSSALEYIQRYISANDTNPAAYKLLGQCYEKLKRPDKQLPAYQRSLELDKKQTDLLVEVCKLLQNNELSDVTPAKARYWYELAESRNIHDSAVLNLKLKFMNGGDQTGVQDIILKEIVRRPHDIALRIRLVYYYLDQNRIDDAFKYVTDIEMKPNQRFRNSIDWYQTVSLVLDKYKERNSATISKNWPYWLQHVTTIERQLFLSLSRSPKENYTISNNLLDATNLLFELDQSLNTVTTSCTFPESERELASQFLSHFRGQLCLHAASLLFKREADQPSRGNWNETTKTALPLLLLAHNLGAVDNNQVWLRNASESTKQLIDLWQAQSSFRVSQATRTLQSCISVNSNSDNPVLANLRKICNDKYSVWSNQDDVLNEIRSIAADSDWRKKLHRNLFNKKDQQTAISGSNLVKSKAFESPTFDWPDVNASSSVELKAQEADPSSLAHQVYLALGVDNRKNSKQSQNTIDPDFKCTLFKNLNYSTSNSMNCTAETLNQLDIEAFLYATTLQTKRNITMDNTMLPGTPGADGNKPKILPYANMANILCTEEQSEWWTAAYKIYQNISGDELAELRATLQYGIEAVRGVVPKMDLIILLKLGQIFAKKAQKTNKTVETGFLEDRCESLFKFALYMLRMQNSSRSTSEPFRRLFKYFVGSNFFEIEQEINALAEEAITFLAGRYFNKNAFEECIEDLSGIKLPFATYFQAESYRKLTEISDTPKKNRRAYLDKARDLLKQTLDLLDAPNTDKNHPLKSIVEEDIKRLQNETRKLETNQSMSDNSFVSANGRSDLEESIGHHYDRETETATPVPHTGYDNIERMMRQMMESLNILKEDVAEVRNRVQNIEEQLNKEEGDSVDILDDYYLDDEIRNPNQNLNNTSMLANVSRNQTLNQQTPKSSQFGKANLQMNANMQQRGMGPGSNFPQGSMPMGNSFNANPLLNNMYGQMHMNPYHQAALAGSQNFNQSPQMSANYSQAPMLPYGNDVFNLHQQMFAQQLTSDPRSPNLMGLLQQQLSGHLSNSPNQPIGQQSYALTNNPLAGGINTMAMSPAQPATINAPMTFDQKPIAPAVPPTATATPPTLASKQWNTSFKNTPVEKGPPVNVVITSSDPVPQNITTITTQATTNFSVTIPPHHIKNNPAVVPSPFGAALANPTITAALTQDKKLSNDPKSISSTSTPPTAQEQKSIFGSLTKPASSTPISSPGSKADTTKTETPKVNPFATLSFGSQTSNQSKPVFSFGNIGQSSLNKSEISSLANAATPETPSQSQTNASASANPNTSLSSPVKEEVEHFEPTAHFEPVIPLPDLVEVKTGEENEIVLFEHRAKLLRYVKELKEWKERGIGNMKVMTNKDDPNKVRLLMRREQVLKLCCNQLLAKDTKFNKMPNTETALTWFGQDYSDNELQVEMLAIRFKTAELCKQFHDAVLAAQAQMTDGKTQPTKSIANEKPTNKPTAKPADKTQSQGFGDKFKPKVGSWTCDACYVTNQAADKKCLSCGSPQDKNAPPEESSKPSSSAAAAPKFSFGNFGAAPAQSKTTEGFGDKFKPKVGSWTCDACYVTNQAADKKCLSCGSPQDKNAPPEESIKTDTTAPKFSFGNLSALNKSTVAEKPNNLSTNANTPTFTFGSPIAPLPQNPPAPSTTSATSTTNAFGSSSFSFSFGPAANTASAPPAAAAAAATATAPSLKPNETSAPALGSNEFGFVFKSKSPAKHTPVANASGVEDVSDDENVEEEENNTYFTPVIPLPDKIEVKTGEEDEDVLYSHRAKLFRFRNSEWRERGLGDVKILKHKQTGQLRVVMRREQIHKICLNHALTPEIEYKLKDPKSWQFVAPDFSESTLETDNFSLRFKTDEIAKDFKKAIDDALAGKGVAIVNGSGDGDQADAAASNATAEESKNITNFQLPGNFYDYKTKTDCTGCRGCSSDDFVFSEYKDTNFGQIDDNPLPLDAPPKVDMTANDLSKDTKKTAQANSFSFASFGNDDKNTFKFATASTANNVQPPGMFFGNSNFKSPFGGDSVKTEEPKTNNTSFGQTNIFGGNAKKTLLPDPVVKPTSSFAFGSANNTFGSGGTPDKPTFSFATSTTTPASDSQEKVTESKSIFGGSATFGKTPLLKTPVTNIFGGNTNGGDPSKPTETPSSGFGFKLPASTTVTPVTSNSSPLLKTPVQSATLNDDSNPLFGSGGGLSFGDLAKTTDSTATVEPFQSSAGGLSFATLAQNSSNGSSTFGKTAPAGGFFGLTNRDTFSNLMQPKATLNGTGQNTSTQDEDSEHVAEDANYDPHYDPIIELPDEIQVSTGEENETKVFGERAKLYRYDSDNKEWKERGVGEFKILHHPANGTYRLLLRREQIHKLVLNMALTADVQINPMKQSDKAFVWVAQNFAEEQVNGELESLSVRFKNADLASKFNDTVKQCIEQLKHREQTH